MKAFTSISLLSLACGLAVSAPAAAQETAPVQDEAASSEVVGSDIVVTARRREERLQDVPVAVTALGGAALRSANIVQVQDVQQKVPGLTIQPSSFGSNVLQVAIRGQRQFDPYITKDPAVAVYFADVVQNRPQGLNSGMFDLQSVQVLKGPQGTLFGRNTTGGAMIITPQAPTDRLEGYVLGSVGNFNAWRAEGALNIPLADWASLRVAGQLQRRDGYTQNVTTGQLLDDEHKDSWRVSLKLTPFDGFENRTVVNGFIANENGIGYKLVAGTSAALQAELARLAALPFWSTTADLPMKTRVATFSLSNVTQYQVSDSVTLKNIFGYRHVTSSLPFDLDGSSVTFSRANGDFQLAPSREDMQVDQYSNELQMLGTVLDGSLDYIVGGFWFLERGRDRQASGGFLGISRALDGADNPQTYIGDRVTYGDPIRNLSYSGFAQFTYRLPFLPGVSLTAGGRETYDQRELTSRNLISNGECRLSGFDPSVLANCQAYNRVGFKRFTYTLSADWKITPDVLAYIAHRKGYRTGGFNISAFNPAGFTPFRPEDVKDVEVGLKTKFQMGGGSGTLNIAAYTQDYQNIQRNQGSTINVNGSDVFVQTIVNAAAARIKGFEIELGLRPVSWLDFGVNVSHIDAKYKDWKDANGNDLSGAMFAGAPAWTISSNVGVRIPVGSSELALRADLYHQTDTNNSDNNWVPVTQTTGFVSPSSILQGYTLLNARAELSNIAGTNLSVALWGKNLTNEKYYASGTDLLPSLGFTANFMGAPRMYGVEARFEF